jgi:hypothetical protein
VDSRDQKQTSGAARRPAKALNNGRLTFKRAATLLNVEPQRVLQIANGKASVPSSSTATCRKLLRELL